MKAVVFDIGKVLVEWDARLAFAPALGSVAAAEAFIAA
jgi:FMN phosphatase YigB (HAD superfamily)